MTNLLKQNETYALAALRIMAALLFFAHGSQKIFSFPTAEFMPPAFSLLWIGGILEMAGGALLALGLFTRPTAFLMSGMMAVAYFLFHAPQSFYPALNGGDAAILFSFVFLFLTFAGPGALSLDARRYSASATKLAAT